MKKVTKFGLEVLTGKALSFWLEFIDKTGEKVFCLQMQIKLKSCVSLFSWLVHKLKGQMNQNFDLFYFSSILVKCIKYEPNKHTIWSFSSIEASISEIFAIKNCCFLALIFVERSEKLWEKTACDVNVGQVKKSGKFKTEIFESTWCRSAEVQP